MRGKNSDRVETPRSKRSRCRATNGPAVGPGSGLVVVFGLPSGGTWRRRLRGGGGRLRRWRRRLASPQKEGCRAVSREFTRSREQDFEEERTLSHREVHPAMRPRFRDKRYTWPRGRDFVGMGSPGHEAGIS
ncbi:hypothetical protein Droror1_Dr00025856 [Drosera rotundifolia]